ncbi:hypothetical protein [Cellulomonas sp. HD19AZ1]|uniref:hypothetical protein n=1 Tax=Cellulomonas sp. HD19AZ1 TaxID=2559593 RepID=UPI001070CBAA|nr:hypothetical protein [Cellulomonas sp. HD19AZ1]TFH72738.1 hypothetical protein E4A51_04715 [Cellulomonas sp. HD19AZ1]
MSVLYRAIWHDESLDEPELSVELALDCFSRWALDDEGAAVLDDGQVFLDRTTGPVARREVTVRRVVRDGSFGAEASVRDIPREGAPAPAVWMTSLRIVADGQRVTAMVENGMETDDPTVHIKVGRPRLVDDLLAVARKPKLGESPILRAAVWISSDEVAALIHVLDDPARTLPYIVFSAPADRVDPQWMARVDRTARRSTGVATVVALDRDAVTALRAELGNLAVWGGAVRTYAPGQALSPAESWRHRYVTGERVRVGDGAIVDRLVYGVAELSARRRVPDAFESLAVDEDGRVDRAEVSRIEEHWELEVMREQEERASVERELAQANGHLTRLRNLLAVHDMEDVYWTARDADESDGIPDDVQDVSEAVLMAQEYLADWVVVPEGAARALDGIDSAPNAYAWGNTAWRGLRALAAYARARAAGGPGDFWAWCQRGEPLAWPATTKKLSMTESDTVQNSTKFTQSRTFRIDPEVVDGGRVVMLAHLKISEGGGNLAPRVYFFDDTDGSTKKVHVGFVGPHYLVPNTRS